MKFILSVHAHVSAIVDAGKSILQLKTIEKINLAQKNMPQSSSTEGHALVWQCSHCCAGKGKCTRAFQHVSNAELRRLSREVGCLLQEMEQTKLKVEIIVKFQIVLSPMRLV